MRFLQRPDDEYPVRQPAPSPVVQPRRFRGWLSLTLKIVAVAAGLGLGLGVFRSPVFAVAEIEVHGLRQVPQSRVLDRVDVRGQNILGLQLPELRQELLNDPWIRTVDVQRRLPDTLSIAVEERAPVLLWQVRGRSFLVDHDGTVLEEARGTYSLPVVRDQDGPTPAAGDLRDAGTVALARTLVEVLPGELGEKAAGFEYLRNGGLVVETDKGHRARFGDASDFQWKLAVWKAVLKEANDQKLKATHVDLRFGDRPFFRP